MSDTIPIRKSSTQGQVVPEFASRAGADAPQPKVESKYPTEVIPLPTKGWFYPENHPLSSGNIELKQMTAREEDILANQELIKRGIVLDKLLEAVVIDKSIRLDDILVPDKNAIFIAIRRLAYNDDYPVSITCPQCNQTSKVTINLADLIFKPFNFDDKPKGQNSFSFKLPSGIQITYKLLCQIDERSIESELKQLSKISKEASGDLTTRLKYLITSVDGNNDRSAVRKFVDEQLTARDSLALRKHMRENNPDVDMTFAFECQTSGCNLERRLDVPIGASFLWPDLDPGR